MAETVIEEHPDWEDRKLSGVTFVYDKIGIADVSATSFSNAITRP